MAPTEQLWTLHVARKRFRWFPFLIVYATYQKRTTRQEIDWMAHQLAGMNTVVEVGFHEGECAP